jgi:protein ImuB
VPGLALQAVLRRAPELRGLPAAVLGTAQAPPRPAPPSAASSPRGLLPNQERARASGRKGAGRPRVVEVSAEARRAGVVPGMTAAQAEAASPGVQLFEVSPADVEAATGALGDVGYAFAPRVDAEPERVFFEVEELGQLYPQGEGAVAQAVQAQAARVGLEARVAIAADKGTARVATRARELAVVPPGAAGARAFLARVPTTLLTADAALAAALRRWGTRTAGEVAVLPVDAVALRLGEPGARACRLARGAPLEGDDPFMPRLPADALEEAIDLDYRVYEIEPLAFVLRGLVDRALARLAGRSLACAGLTVRLTLDPRGLDVRAVPIAAPTRDAATLIQLLRLDLARRPPDAPVTGARLVALPARVRATQLDILRPAGPAPDRLAATVARLAALVGPENVGAPALEDTWREEAVRVAPFALTATPPPEGAAEGGGGGRVGSPSRSAAEGGGGGRVGSPSRSAAEGGGRPQAANDVPEAAPLAIRRLRPAQEIEVLVGRAGPTALRGRDTTARVLAAAGPYRASGEWWRATAEGGGWAREYWDVHASDGALYRVHQDRDGRWFLDGYYD